MNSYNYCEKYADSIEDLVEGELEEQIAAPINSHLFVCAGCREFYETLKREKEIYARYLFAAEPPHDLWASFQTRLEAEKDKTFRAAETPAKTPARSADVFGFWRRSPAFAFAAALLVWLGIGFGWLKFAPAEKDAGRESAAETNFTGSQPAAKNPFQNQSAAAPDSSTQIVGGETTTAPERIHDDHRNRPLTGKNVTAAPLEHGGAKAEKISEKTVSENREKNSAGAAANDGRLTVDKLERLRLLDLATETAKQIERVEMLLRSFRNARADEGFESFDVAYEKQQARRLLEKNSELRRAAEAGGNLYAEELLSRVEPHLLDIANLENDPAPERVLDIKERVKNQNIIASLQTY